jgi:UDP-glucose 4-epimerase
VEGYVRGFARRRPDVGITTLRLANIIGPGIRTAMTDYFALPVIPAPLGFDARLQFVHETDAAACLVLATTGPRAVGNVNVAGAGVITLMQAAAMVGRPIFPGPAARGRLPRRHGQAGRARRLLGRPDAVPRLRPRPRHDAYA